MERPTPQPPPFLEGVDWAPKAPCFYVDNRIFINRGIQKLPVVEALAVCHGCKRKEECYDESVERIVRFEEVEGVRAGLSKGQIRKILAQKEIGFNAKVISAAVARFYLQNSLDVDYHLTEMAEELSAAADE